MKLDGSSEVKAIAGENLVFTASARRKLDRLQSSASSAPSSSSSNSASPKKSQSPSKRGSVSSAESPEKSTSTSSTNAPLPPQNERASCLMSPIIRGHPAGNAYCKDVTVSAGKNQTVEMDLAVRARGDVIILWYDYTGGSSNSLLK